MLYAGKKRDEIISFKDLDKISQQHGLTTTWMTTSIRLRRLWRAGKIERYVAGKYTANGLEGGKWHGVHYRLYIKEK